LDWRLFLPEEWDSDEERRRKAGVAEEVRHEPKWRLALRMLDELRGWGLESPPILADAAYGDITEFRSGLDERELRYVLQVKGQTSAYAEGVRPATTDYRGTGRPPRPRYREKPSSLRELALAEGAEQAVEVSWREGSDGEPLSSRFLLLRVRPANVKLRRQAKDSELPVRWLICEWPQGQAEPAKYWLSNLPEDAEPERLVALAKAPLADRARLPRAQGLPRARPLRGALLPGLAPPRDARLGGARLPHARAAQPKSPCGDLTLFRVLRELQQLVACWSGTCPTCKRRLPRKTAYLKASPVPT
ncbi:MAG: IS701 family transposase, partial [Solirubrobacteraceae bacterium]